MTNLLTGASIVSFMMVMVDKFFAPGLLAGIWSLITNLL